MNAKKILSSVILLAAAAALAWPAPAFAKKDSPADKPGDKPAAAKEQSSGDSEKSGDSGKGDNPAALGADIDFDFDKLAAETINYNPDGSLHMIGSVEFKSDQLALTSNDLVYNKNSKILTASGSPVQITQNNVKAECRDFHYDVDKKQSRLTGNPFIYQKNNDGSMTRIRGDVIVITQGANGQASVSVQSHTISVIDRTGNSGKKSDSGDKKSKPRTQAKKVNPDNAELIKLPSVE